MTVHSSSLPWGPMPSVTQLSSLVRWQNSWPEVMTHIGGGGGGVDGGGVWHTPWGQFCVWQPVALPMKPECPRSSLQSGSATPSPSQSTSE